MDCQIPLRSPVLSVVYMKIEFSHSRRKVRSTLILVRLRNIIYLFIFLLLLWDNNCISNKKAIQLNYIRPNKIVLMQIISVTQMSQLWQTVLTLYKSNQNWISRVYRRKRGEMFLSLGGSMVICITIKPKYLL